MTLDTVVKIHIYEIFPMTNNEHRRSRSVHHNTCVLHRFVFHQGGHSLPSPLGWFSQDCTSGSQYLSFRSCSFHIQTHAFYLNCSKILLLDLNLDPKGTSKLTFLQLVLQISYIFIHKGNIIVCLENWIIEISLKFHEDLEFPRL